MTAGWSSTALDLTWDTSRSSFPTSSLFPPKYSNIYKWNIRETTSGNGWRSTENLPGALLFFHGDTAENVPLGTCFPPSSCSEMNLQINVTRRVRKSLHSDDFWKIPIHTLSKLQMESNWTGKNVTSPVKWCGEHTEGLGGWVKAGTAFTRGDLAAPPAGIQTDFKHLEFCLLPAWKGKTNRAWREGGICFPG